MTLIELLRQCLVITADLPFSYKEADFEGLTKTQDEE